MSWFTEDSTPVLILGVVTAAILLVAFVKTSRLGLLYAIVGVALVVAAVVFIEKHTDTDTKRVRRVLDAACVAVEKNDVPGALALIAPSAKEMRNSKCCTLLPCKFEIHEACHSRFGRQVQPLQFPADGVWPSSWGTSIGMRRAPCCPEEHYPQRVKVTLHLEGDRWLMDGYKMEGFGIGGPN